MSEKGEIVKLSTSLGYRHLYSVTHVLAPQSEFKKEADSVRDRILREPEVVLRRETTREGPESAERHFSFAMQEEDEAPYALLDVQVKRVGERLLIMRVERPIAAGNDGSMERFFASAAPLSQDGKSAAE